MSSYSKDYMKEYRKQLSEYLCKLKKLYAWETNINDRVCGVQSPFLAIIDILLFPAFSILTYDPGEY